MMMTNFVYISRDGTFHISRDLPLFQFLGSVHILPATLFRAYSSEALWFSDSSLQLCAALALLILWQCRATKTLAALAEESPNEK